MIDIALFPIPECVSFPGTVFPLHVFEPRYREMVHYCIQNDMPMAVCHTKKVIHSVKAHQEISEILSSNQSTYKPHSVFSAGKCELVEVLEDGRMIINVYIDERYQCVEEVQTLPFRICKCELYEDFPDNDQSDLSNRLQDDIIRRLLELTEKNENSLKIISTQRWQGMSPIDFSFEMLSLIKPEADIAQQMLEMRSANERMQALLNLLS